MTRMVLVIFLVSSLIVPASVAHSSYRTSTSVWDLQQELSPITLGSGAMYVSGTGIRISGTNTTAQALFQGVNAPFGVNNIVPSWNVDMPDGTGIRIELRATNGGTSTAWYEIARQGTTNLSWSRKEWDSYGEVDWDTLTLYSNWPRIEYRVTLFTNTIGVTPTLRLMALCYADDNYLIPYTALPNPGVTTSLAVPWRSQYASSLDPDEICGPRGLAPLATQRFYCGGVHVLKRTYLVKEVLVAVHRCALLWPLPVLASRQPCSRTRQANRRSAGIVVC